MPFGSRTADRGHAEPGLLGVVCVRAVSSTSTLHTGSWSWRSYIKKGSPTPTSDAFKQHCPTTTALIDSTPSLFSQNPFGYAFFSTQAGGGLIAPHAGPTNARLRVHLPLVLPPSGGSCGIRVGGVDRIYEEGKCVVFDDSYLHETWNDGEGERVLLLFDVWYTTRVPPREIILH